MLEARAALQAERRADENTVGVRQAARGGTTRPDDRRTPSVSASCCHPFCGQCGIFWFAEMQVIREVAEEACKAKERIVERVHPAPRCERLILKEEVAQRMETVVVPRLAVREVKDRGVRQQARMRLLPLFALCKRRTIEALLHVPFRRQFHPLTVEKILVVEADAFRMAVIIVLTLLSYLVFAPVLQVHEQHSRVEIRLRLRIAQSLKALVFIAAHVLHRRQSFPRDVRLPKLFQRVEHEHVTVQINHSVNRGRQRLRQKAAEIGRQ